MSAPATDARTLKMIAILDEGRIAEVANARVFFIDSPSGQQYLTVLTPGHAHCTCPAKHGCAHIDAAYSLARKAERPAA